MTLTHDAATQMRTRLDALTVIQRAIELFGVASVAKKVGMHPDTVKNWKAGANLPSGPTAARILYVYAALTAPKPKGKRAKGAA